MTNRSTWRSSLCDCGNTEPDACEVCLCGALCPAVVYGATSARRQPERDPQPHRDFPLATCGRRAAESRLNPASNQPPTSAQARSSAVSTTIASPRCARARATPDAALRSFSSTFSPWVSPASRASTPAARGPNSGTCTDSPWPTDAPRTAARTSSATDAPSRKISCSSAPNSARDDVWARSSSPRTWRRAAPPAPYRASAPASTRPPSNAPYAREAERRGQRSRITPRVRVYAHANEGCTRRPRARPRRTARDDDSRLVTTRSISNFLNPRFSRSPPVPGAFPRTSVSRASAPLPSAPPSFLPPFPRPPRPATFFHHLHLRSGGTAAGVLGPPVFGDLGEDGVRRRRRSLAAAARSAAVDTPTPKFTSRFRERNPPYPT
jgi:hypothetical protein